MLVLKAAKRIGLALIIVLALFKLADYLYPLPDIQLNSAQTVLSREGIPLWRFADENGLWRYQISQDEASLAYLEAVLAYEDRWFYWHWGVNPVAIVRAFLLNQQHGRIISGGSTLTMQVARIIDPHSRTYTGKLRQLWRTLQLEWHFSKQEILETYLNRASFGGTIEGVAAASWAYLGKPPSVLSDAEAALLAVLPQAPSRLRPDRYPERAKQARNKLLARLQTHGVWSPERLTDAMQEDFWLSSRQEPSLAPLLARRLASASTASVITSTVDFNLQYRLEELLLNHKSQLPPHVSMAVLVANSQTGEVLAYLGSVDLADDSRLGHVDMVRAIRSPGSTLKPFLYALALEDGLIHSESLLQDVPRNYTQYQPGNFSQGFSGPVSASYALRQSLNLPAVQLLEYYGPQRMAAKFQQAELALIFPKHSSPNLAMILGGVGTRLETLVAAYSAFDQQGEVTHLMYQPNRSAKTVPLLDAGAAWVTKQILIGQGGPNQVHRMKRPDFGWKTGTSHSHRDALAIGVGHGYSIGVWVGRPDGAAVPGQYGQISAVPVLMQVYDALVQPNDTLLSRAQRPDNVTVNNICWPSGLRQEQTQAANCREQRTAWVLNGITPPTLPLKGFKQNTKQTVWLDNEGYRVDVNCTGAQRAEVDIWPLGLDSWLPPAERYNARMPQASMACPPPLLATRGQLQLLGVERHARLLIPASQRNKELELVLRAEGAQGELWWFVDGELVKNETTEAELKWVFARMGKHQVSIIDRSGQKAMIDFKLQQAD